MSRMAYPEETRVTITRAERLRIPRELNSGRVAKLKAFKTRIPDWAEPSLQVFDEPIIVCLKQRRELKVDEEKEWFVERCYDHFHQDIIRFEELIDRKKAGYAVSAKDAVLAYMLVWKRGSRHLIAGFLSSTYIDGTPSFPDWRYVSAETVGQALSRLKTEGWISA